MALINRLSRLFQADLNAVLDTVEEPALLLRQSVRDMEAEVAAEQRRIRCQELDLAEMLRQEKEHADSLASIEEEIGVCFDSDQEELARSMVRRRLQTQRQIQTLSRRRERLDEELALAKSALKDHVRRLDSMRQKAELLNSGPADSPPPADRGDISDEEVEVAFLREKQRRAQS